MFIIVFLSQLSFRQPIMSTIDFDRNQFRHTSFRYASDTMLVSPTSEWDFLACKRSIRIRKLISQRKSRTVKFSVEKGETKREKRRRSGGGWKTREKEYEREEKRNSEGPCGVSRDIKSYYVYAMPPPKYSLLRYRVLMELL